jgi:hypothetical protein
MPGIPGVIHHSKDLQPPSNVQSKHRAGPFGSGSYYVRHRQGRLIGRMQELGFPLREEAVLQTLTEDVLKSGELEGEIPDKEQVRSSIARRLGIDAAALPSADRNVEDVVEMMLDATQKYQEKLTRERLFAWHASLFPTGQAA